MYAGSAAAQTTTAQGDTAAELEAAGESGNDEIVVTGSRIQRSGFDQPTPTLVVGEEEIEQAARSNIQQVLADQPQVRPSSAPTTTVGNTTSGIASVDLRGLGSGRTLVLVNGRRSVAENNVNFVPVGLVQRLDIVTGGASAAYGSGAVAGVVNIVFKDDLEGLTLGAQTGISSRGDAMRYGFEGTFGTHFAGGNGHFMVGAEYLNDKGIGPKGRLDRRNIGSGGIVTINGQRVLVEDVNSSTQSYGGLITSGILAGQTFDPNGTLRPFRGPDASGIGGEDASGLYDDIYAAAPFERLSVYGRASYDIGNATLWADAAYGRVKSNYDFLSDIAVGAVTIQATNPFLPQAARDQLAAAGQTSFTLGRVYTDIFPMFAILDREIMEGAIGIDGTFGSGWKYSAHFSHGEIEGREAFENSRVAPNFSNALNAVMSGGQIVCGVNADANPNNNDPACQPINIFGQNNASPEALAYVRDTQGANTIRKLDSAGFELQGTPFSLWAGPISVAVGAEARWEEQATAQDENTRGRTDFGFLLFSPGNDIAGGFNVKEAFAETVIPLLDADQFKVELNGAARYSDYSTSGGIWTWKVGGTARLFDDLLLRATRSRDIRSPSIDQLFALARQTIGPLTDQNQPANPPAGYNPNPSGVNTFSGGNADLQPEISNMLTVGATYSPSFINGLRLSLDYYDIKITDAIGSLGGGNLTLACRLGSQAACDRVIRDPVTQTVTTVFSNLQNLQRFETSGFDMEASYAMPISQIIGDKQGTLRFRALATYIKDFISDNGLITPPLDGVGSIGNSGGIPKWRAIFTASYQDDIIGLNTRVRYVDGGKYDKFATGLRDPNNPNLFAPGYSALLTNNDIDSRIYVDVGAQFKVMDRFTFFGNVTNLFDADLPTVTTTGSVHFDTVGRYFSAGVRLNF